MCIRRVFGTELFYSLREQMSSKDAGVLRKKAEDKPCHEVIHVMTPLRFRPFCIVFQQLQIEPVHADCCPDIEGVLFDLLYSRDASKRQKEAEMVRKITI